MNNLQSTYNGTNSTMNNLTIRCGYNYSETN